MILVDDSPRQPASPVQTVREFAQSLSAGASASERRMVVAIYRNGEQMQEGPDLNILLNMPAESVEQLELMTQPVGPLVCTALDEALALLDEAQAAREEAADRLDSGDQPAAMSGIQRMVLNWQAIQKSLSLSAEALEIELDSLNIDDRSFVDFVQEMKHRLTELKNAMDLRDHVMVTDLLRYELSETLDTWRPIIQTLRNRLTS